MTGLAWIFLGVFIAALVLLVIALVVIDEQDHELKRLRRKSTLRILELEQEKPR